MFSILHSFLFAIYPIIELLSHNAGEIQFSEIYRSLIVSILLTGMLLLLLKLFFKEWERSSLILTGILIFFFSYGHLYSFLKSMEIGGFVLGRHRWMLPLAGLILYIWIWFVWRRLKDPRGFVRFFNFMGVLLLIPSTYTILSTGFRQFGEDAASSRIASAAQEVKADVRPDIYYIILDGYGRSDVIKELYNYDNSGFLDFLKSRGFFIADGSHSNYNQTALSLASSMNLKYINYFSETLGVDTKKRFEVAQLIKRNLIRELLEARGYRFVSFETGYERTEIRSADFYWSASSDAVPQITAIRSISAFESLLLESTAFRAVFDVIILSQESLRKIVLDSEYKAHRERVLYTFSRLDDVAEMDGDFFVFAHIVSPHPPFVFDSNGEAVTPARAYRIADGNYYPGTRDEYLKGYRDQVIFVNKQLEAVIDQILSKSNPPPVIIIQGDHGPGAYLVWDSPEKSNLDERFGILNAYYFPGGDQGWLYPTVTPVNTFRIVLNRFFDEDYKLLEDESYFSPWMRPYDFIRVTDLINSN
jgi:hypothetical protein